MCRYCNSPTVERNNKFYYPVHEPNEDDLSIISYSPTTKKFYFGEATVGSPDNVISYCPHCGRKLEWREGYNTKMALNKKGGLSEERPPH